MVKCIKCEPIGKNTILPIKIRYLYQAKSEQLNHFKVIMFNQTFRYIFTIKKFFALNPSNFNKKLYVVWKRNVLEGI
jgi:hypothetical protein